MAGFFDFIKKPSPKSSTQSPAPAAAPVSLSKSTTVTADHEEAHNTMSVPATAPPATSFTVPVPSARHDRVDPSKLADLRAAPNNLTAAPAGDHKNEYVDSEHILHGLLSDNEIYSFFVESKIQPQTIEEELGKLYKHETRAAAPPLSPRVKRIVNTALTTARKLGFEFISPEHLLLALYEEGEGAGARVLTKLGLKKDDLNKKITGKKDGLEEGAVKQKKKNVLEDFTIDLTAKAAQGTLDPVVERSEVIERVIHILSRRTKNNPSLVGEAGVGKTAIVEGLAEKIVAKQVPEPLLNKRILELDLMSLLAGASHRGDFEERMKDLIEEVKKSQGQIILFIDEIHNIVGAGSSGEGSLDASNFLKPALARGEIQLIGATTLTEYRKYIEKDPALERRFQPVLVPEPTEEQAIKMLQAIKDKYEAFHRVKIPEEAIEAAVKFSKRYVGDRFLPDKAVDLIDEAASAVRLPLISLPEEITSLQTRLAQLNQELKETEKTADRVKARTLRSKIAEIDSSLKEKKDEYDRKKAQTTTSVGVEIIKDIVARWTGIPVAKVTGSEMERLANLEKILHERLIDQEAAVGVVAQAIRRGRAGLKSATRPIGSFVFLGPTGVGKTELAKALAEILFGQEEAMIRFDMAEYMEKHEVAKLLGAPPGYVGYEEGGKLTEAVRRRPYSVVLFDEVEKANPDIFNILLQILDDGRLTDNKGHVVSFKNTVVICTSNIGTALIQNELIKNGKTEIEEPPILSTYVFTQSNQEFLTIGSKGFVREGQGRWKAVTLFDYFAGQTMLGENRSDFPIHGFNTHAVSPSGVEMITKNNTIFSRSSTAAKEWRRQTLSDYFKDGVVVNALSDGRDEQLPATKIKTQAFTPNANEIITDKDRYWVRKVNAKEWTTGRLKDYFEGQTVQKAPASQWDIHVFDQKGTEYIIVGDRISIKESALKVWQEKAVKEYFGADFPLEKEIAEKAKVDTEVDLKKYALIKDEVMGELRKFFRPELINRFDDIIIFEPLKFVHMIQIVKLQLKSVGKLLEDQGIGFTATAAAVKEIVRAGFDPLYGARPLRRAIQILIENPISTLIIEKKVSPADQIVGDFDGENFRFTVEKTEMVSADKVEKTPLTMFMCQSCRHEFTTQILEHATPLCRQCGSVKLIPTGK
ncbi:AAA family ATPase [Candidatus Roizmanbacteria bacterium]|nr:AAA family ATPase [Candidatus Roizmanbacteria bacterium]